VIIARAPLRISFFGGGTEYPRALKLLGGGAVLSAAIDQCVTVILREMRNPACFGNRSKIVWHEVEEPDHVSAIKHPAVRAVLERYRISQAVEVVHLGDLPARSGLGSSGAFLVAMIAAARKLKQEWPITVRSVATEAQQIDRELDGTRVGLQDPVAAAFGGLNEIRFDANGAYELRSIGKPQRIESALLLAYTGRQRDAALVAARQVLRTDENEAVLREILASVDSGLEALWADDAERLGRLLDAAWTLKKLLGPVTLPEIDRLYECARGAGAWGGKLCGAGGGGFVLLCAPPEKHAGIRDALGVPVLPVRFSSFGLNIAEV